MKIEQLTEASEDILADINRVNAQLHDDDRAGSLQDLQSIVANPNHALVVVKDGDKVIGIATLYSYQKIGKRSGTVEDVVVDSAYRGQGLGEKLMRKVLEVAREKKVDSLYLTSRPIHEAAHGLYRKVGFEVKETTVFKIKP